MTTTIGNDSNESYIEEIDHQKVRAPYVRLSSCSIGEKGDIACVYDIRLTQPNTAYLKADVLHSLEHFLLAGFREKMKDNFVCVAPMGCQTGFYLILLNFKDVDKLCVILQALLNEVLLKENVPYLDSASCGQYLYHNLNATKQVIEQFLENQSDWRNIF